MVVVFVRMMRLPIVPLTVVLLCCCEGWAGGGAFYQTETNPRSFEEGQPVELRVNKLTSRKTLLPMDYYRLPFCLPMMDDGLRSGSMGNDDDDDNNNAEEFTTLMGEPSRRQNLGQWLAGDRIEISPYKLRMKRDAYCKKLCFSNLGRREQRGQPNKNNRVVRAIRKNYHHNWILDNLNAASKLEDDANVTRRYWPGTIPVGFVAYARSSSRSPYIQNPANRKAYVYNHVNIEIMYHPAPPDDSGIPKYRVVRFVVEPFSIKHEFELDEQPGKIINPIESCNKSSPDYYRKHTTYDMITAPGREPQEASGKVLFTYDVIWMLNDDLQWSDRWDIYVSMDNAVPDMVHWSSIVNSIVLMVMLLASIAVILTRNLVRDKDPNDRNASSTTSRENDDDHQESAEEENDLKAPLVQKPVKWQRKWKLVRDDVFRPPDASPVLLSICCGTGAQLLGAFFLTVLFAALGFMNPARRGRLLMVGLLLFVAMGVVNGYVTSRLFKTFTGEAYCHRATALAALGYPGLGFLVFLIVNALAMVKGSSLAVPCKIMLMLVGLWLGIAAPLVYLGAYFGYMQDGLEFPVGTSSSAPRRIPRQPRTRSIPCTLAMGGILPYSACYVELYFVLRSAWQGDYYPAFGFILLVFVIAMFTCALTTAILTYFQLCSEDYRWWWRSFTNAGSAAIYVFLYGVIYFRELEANSLATYVIYFGYMAVISAGLFAMMGFVGLAASLWFNRTIFSTLPRVVDEECSG